MYKSVNDLATELGVTRVTIFRHAKRLGIGGYSDANDGRVRLFDTDQQRQLTDVILRKVRLPKAVREVETN